MVPHEVARGLNRRAATVQNLAQFSRLIRQDVQGEPQRLRNSRRPGHRRLGPESAVRRTALLAVGNLADGIFPGRFRLAQVRERLALEPAQEGIGQRVGGINGIALALLLAVDGSGDRRGCP